MKIKEAEALEIAKKFALSEYQGSEWPLDIDDTNIKLNEGGYGTDFLGLSIKRGQSPLLNNLWPIHCFLPE